jgi:serine/threonine-protein kinase
MTGKSSVPKTIFGYEVIDHLGEGAGSRLYVVSKPKTGQLYALKHVQPKEEKEQRFVDQLRTEFEVSKVFRHPALRKSADLQTRRRLFGPVVEAALVMELVDGIPMDREQPRDLPNLVDCFEQTAVALTTLHNLLYVHCDLKPSNILVQADGLIKLIDFGQTCHIGTIKKRVQGTPDFIAPEQVRLNAVGVYTDIYNLGATLYWALTRQKVPTLLTVRRRDRDVVREQKFPKPIELKPDIPLALSDLVMSCVNVNPSLRPQSMNELLTGLTPYGLDREH